MASKKVVELFGISSRTCKANFANVIVRNRSNLPSDSTQKVTHTGQVFEEDDYRNVRFACRPKEVNDNWAIKLIDEVPPAPAKERIVACDGGGGPLGHPKVYINLDKPGNHTCGYCGLRFHKEGH